jgi:cytidine deaminase
MPGGAAAGRRGGHGRRRRAIDAAITPCGRCRQVLNELAALGGTDPLVLCVGTREVIEVRLSALLPHAFGPASLV